MGAGMNNYDALNGGTRVRLSGYRYKARQCTQRVAQREGRDSTLNNMPSDGWKHHRGAWMGDTAHGAHFAPGCDSAGLPATVAAGFRDVGDSHDIVRMRHTGWYTDMDALEKICGHVWQLPARNGEPVYLAGYEGKGEGYIVLEANGNRFATYDDKEDAARAADGLAEKHAEMDREYDERWQAAGEADNEADDAKQGMRDVHKRLRHIVKTIRVLRNAHEDALTAVHLEDVQDMRDEHKRLLNTYIEKRAIVASYAREGIEL